MAIGPTIFRREFHRVPNPNEAFRDFEAEPDFAKANFVDFFGKTWLPSHPNAVTFDDVLRPMWNESQPPTEHVFFRIFAVSDGSIVQSNAENEKWLSQGLRFIAIVAGSPDESISPQPFGNKCWTLCIVGSSAVTSSTAFLQVASWDGTCFRYYGRERVNGQPRWIFMGDSFRAFGEQSYLGPFNGHVNGSLVMKELHRPWVHWLVPGNGFVNRMKKSVLDSLSKVPYISDPEDSDPAHSVNSAGGILSKVESAELMESHLTSGVNRWYDSRRQTDFFDEKKQPRSEVKNVKRWVAHILLTTTVNIVAGADNPSGTDLIDFPINHFYNSAVFGNVAAVNIQPTVETGNKIVMSTPAYENALNAIGLALVQPSPPINQPQPDYSKHPKLKEKVPTFGQEREMFIVQAGEGEDISFTALHASYEDSQATSILMNLKTPILSKDFISALLMVDPWNPVYSWRRGVLMQYVPETTKLSGPFDPKNPTAVTYDLEAKIEAAVRASPRFKNETDSPEKEFIANLEAQRKGTAKFDERMDSYLTKVMGRLGDPKNAKDAVLDYMKLAESRRRVFRPVPLDEFALTLPWATKWEANGPLEMTSEGTIRLIPARGKKFLQQWIGSLASWDPQIMPKPDANEDIDSSAAMSLFSLDEPAVLNIGCQAFKIPEYRLGGGCPMMSLRQQQGE